MKEILAMGGSKEDLELLNGIDSDSGEEPEESNDKNTEQAGKKPKKNKPFESSMAEEPELKNEVADFMKSLFGSVHMDHKKMSLAAELEADEDEGEDGEENGKNDESEARGDPEEENQSDGTWETDESEDVDEGNDSGSDSMDDLPQELKAINRMLDEKKRKSESTSSPSMLSQPLKKAKVKANSLPEKATIPVSSVTKEKKNVLIDIKKQLSTILAKSEGKSEKKFKETSASSKVTPTTSAASKQKLKPKNAATASISKASSSTKVTWNLGDGWSKAFENELDDETFSKSKNKRQKKHQKRHKH
ncbi:hypothetical protein BX616_007087 [Lobosporangium transversale]|uniref:Uncharacterized protein n=1 Tax=Lobosporangium transversale TaxID=64571 RepID=A0A1Y2GCB9_9FUNG|nr:hypothetical protein BCR41DRAFT_373926 [Lobosporangium transversale]KAF9915025.1 hypothetical protein BX616_007087 [Lobosporangium transversale]ORZ06814.1 hypothetical protein BCR41DRAFT_373926 [Lobosporangium transversale]|eukprot:XP_021877735.1 hypothetical protein BCR41DRAFT_373926 [Lobosporangium transversale]